MLHRSPVEKGVDVIILVVLLLLAASCVIPFLHIASISLSDSHAADAGRVGLWPVLPTLSSYEFAFQKDDVWRSFIVTLERVALGVVVNMTLLIFTAYPLSKGKGVFKGRTWIAWYFVITMFVGGGLVPTYMIVKETGLKNTLWALVVPGALSVYNMLVLLSFYRTIPAELEQSAVIDGASQLTILLRIYVPLSVPALATLLIYTVVGHWNEWFGALIYMDSAKNYPLQTYLQNIIVNPDFTTMDYNQLELMLKVNNKTFKATQIMIATVPVLCVYPFLQRYFIKGMTLGAVKG